jgi:hypothetical protein
LIKVVAAVLFVAWYLIFFHWEPIRNIKMDFVDILVTAAVILLVFGWSNVSRAISPSDFERKKQNYFTFYRREGIDLARGEDIRRELYRRGMQDVPGFHGDDSDYMTLATLEALLDTTPRLQGLVQPQETTFPLIKTYEDPILARFPDADDA